MGVTDLVRRFRKELQPTEKLNKGVATENFIASVRAVGATHRDGAVFLSSNEQDVLLYFDAAAAFTKDQKQNATFNSRVFYLYAASSL